ncbi:MAG: TetR/AcrR family transcriptional regulator [Rhizobiaceae bacterium]
MRKVDPEGKRAAILEAAQDLFAKQGFEKTVIADIAGRANVAVGSVHRIFGDKNHLLLAAQSEIESRFIAAMRAGWNKPGTLATRFRSMLRTLFDEMLAMHHLMPLMALKAEGAWNATAKDGHTLLTEISAMMNAAVAKGEFRPVPVDLAAPITVGMVDATMKAAFAAGDPSRIDQHIELLADAMERFLGNDA